MFDSPCAGVWGGKGKGRGGEKRGGGEEERNEATVVLRPEREVEGGDVGGERQRRPILTLPALLSR